MNENGSPQEEHDPEWASEEEIAAEPQTDDALSEEGEPETAKPKMYYERMNARPFYEQLATILYIVLRAQQDLGFVQSLQTEGLDPAVGTITVEITAQELQMLNGACHVIGFFGADLGEVAGQFLEKTNALNEKELDSRTPEQIEEIDNIERRMHTRAMADLLGVTPEEFEQAMEKEEVAALTPEGEDTVLQ